VYRRIEVTDAGEIRIGERESPPVTAGMARLAISYCSINRGDIERIRGSYGGVDSTSIPFWRTEGGFFIPGYEPAGTIVEVGADIDQSLVGRRAVLHSHESCGRCRYCIAGADNLCGKMRVFSVNTFGQGGWAQEIVAPAGQILTLRDNVDLSGACTYEVTYGTVLHNLRRGLELTTLPGPVAVRGVPGALALAAAQFCVAMELACAVIVRAPESSRVQQFRELLPEVAVVAEQDGPSGVRHALGAPPALIIEPLGGRYLAEDIELVARGGAVGVLGSHIAATSDIRADLLFLKGVSLYGTPRAPLAEMEEVASLVAQEFITPQIDRVFALADVVAALDYCEHPSGLGRVLLAMR
jgi:D-arabinose 1-dehydrogenase-like Zn-dependent alcohol dehydrogenase